MPTHHPRDASVTRWPRPDSPYIPGQTARPAEDFFDAIKEDRATALAAGLHYFEQGYFWECHEVLEAVWMDCPDPSPDRILVQAIIQLANARLKLAMNRPKAARRLCAIVDDLLSELEPGVRPLGLDPNPWHMRLDETRRSADDQQDQGA